MEIPGSPEFFVAVIVILLALLELCIGCDNIRHTNALASDEVDGEIAGDAKHVNRIINRKRPTRLNADVLVDVVRFSSPHTIEACCVSSRQLNTIVALLKKSRPLRSIDFVQIAAHSMWSSVVKIRCHTQARHRSTGKSFRDFALREMRYALGNCHVRRLRIDDPVGESTANLADVAKDGRCHVVDLEVNHAAGVLDAADYESVWRIVAALSPNRVRCVFHESARLYVGVTTPDFMNAHPVVVKGRMQPTKSLLRYVTTGRRGSLCWLSNGKYPSDGCNFVKAVIETFQAQPEIGSFEDPLFLQYPYRPVGWSSEAACIESHLGPESELIVDDVEFRNLARFYPHSTTIFAEHLVRCSDKYKAFLLENTVGQRIFVVASDDDSSTMDGNYWLQRVAFLPDLTILRD